jgi:hypothetical protein
MGPPVGRFDGVMPGTGGHVPTSKRVGRPIRAKAHAKDDPQRVIFRFSRPVLTISGTAPSRVAGLLRAIMACKRDWL